MKVTFTKAFNRQLGKIKSKQVVLELLRVITALEQAENIHDIPNLKKLKGHRFAYRIRIENYRMGLYIVKNEVELSTIAHRKDIYKKFP